MFTTGTQQQAAKLAAAQCGVMLELYTLRAHADASLS
jgi:hypothetical protein